MFKNLSECEIFKEYCWLYSFLSRFNDSEYNDISLTSHTFNTVLQNHEILDNNRHWSQLVFLEAYYIENHDLILNHVLKASKRFLLSD